MSVRDPATGVERRRIEIPSLIHLATEGNDLVCVLETKHGRSVAGWDLERLEQRWTFELADLIVTGLVAGGRIYLDGGTLDGESSVIEARDIATGERVWTREISGAGAREGPRTVSVDPRGIAFVSGRHGIVFEADSAADFRVEAGEGVRALHADYERLVVARERELELYDLAAKRSLWKAPIPPLARIQVAIAGEHVWVAGLLHEPERLVVLALEASTGLDLRREVVHEVDVGTPCLLPLDGAVVVCARAQDRHVAIRLEET